MSTIGTGVYFWEGKHTLYRTRVIASAKQGPKTGTVCTNSQ